MIARQSQRLAWHDEVTSRELGRVMFSRFVKLDLLATPVNTSMSH